MGRKVGREVEREVDRELLKFSKGFEEVTVSIELDSVRWCKELAGRWGGSMGGGEGGGEEGGEEVGEVGGEGVVEVLKGIRGGDGFD